MWARVRVTVQCPPTFAAHALAELGQLWSSKKIHNPLVRAGVAAAKDKAHKAEVRLNAVQLGHLLCYGDVSSHFDGRIHLTRRYLGGEERHLFYSLLSCGRALADGTEQVAAVTYNEGTHTLSLRFQIFVTAERRMRYVASPGGPVRCAMDLDDLVRYEM